MAKRSGLLEAVQCYVAPSRFLARTVVDMGLPARRMAVIPNPTPVGPSQPPQSGRSGLLFVGRLSSEKGLALLLEALAGLSGSRLDVVGDGPDRFELERLAWQLGVDARFHGWVTPAHVQERMRSAAVLTVPSVWFENCPLVVLEAMAEGLVVVGNRMGGLTELLDDGECGYLVPTADSASWTALLREVLEDESGRAVLAMKARARVVDRHSPDVFLSRLLSVYDSAVRSRTRDSIR